MNQKTAKLLPALPKAEEKRNLIVDRRKACLRGANSELIVLRKYKFSMAGLFVCHLIRNRDDEPQYEIWIRAGLGASWRCSRGFLAQAQNRLAGRYLLHL